MFVFIHTIIQKIFLHLTNLKATMKYLHYKNPSFSLDIIAALILFKSNMMSRLFFIHKEENVMCIIFQ